MPPGPYPLYVYGFGWMKAYLQQENYHVVYIPRGDLNLDVEVMKIKWAQAIEARQQFENVEELLDVRLVMETYHLESNQIKTCMEIKDGKGNV